MAEEQKSSEDIRDEAIQAVWALIKDSADYIRKSLERDSAGTLIVGPQGLAELIEAVAELEGELEEDDD